jgi:hypothetical protein
VVVLVASALAAGGWAARRPLGTAAGWVADRGESAAGAIEGWATRLQSIAAVVPQRELQQRTAIPGSRSVLVVVGTGPGDCAFALVAAFPEGPPTLTILPQSLLGVVPGYGQFTLAEALSFEGPELAALTVANELGVRIDDVLALAPGDLARALPAKVPVDLPVALFADRGEGPVQVVGAGPQQVPPATIEVLLVTAGAGDTLEWLQRQGAAWRGVLGVAALDAEVADRLAALPGDPAATVANLLLAAATAESLELGAPPVEAAAASAPGTLALSAVAAEFVGARLGHLLLLAGERPRVEVLNGNGRIGATRVVAEAVVRRGYRVVRTDNADRFDYPSTLVIAQGAGAQEAAREVAGIVGAASVYLEEADPSPLVEVSIIVGLDIPAGEA